MARKIQHKRGLEKNLPTLATGEFALTTDTKKVFIGTDNGNIEVTGGTDAETKQKVEGLTAQLEDTVKEVNGVKPTNGKVTVPVPDEGVTSTKLANGAVTYNKRTLLGNNASVNCLKKPANYDTANGKLTVYSGTVITHGRGFHEISSDVVLDLNGTGSLHKKIVYDTVAGKLLVLPYDDYTSVNIENCLFLGTVNNYPDNRKMNLIFDCTVDGVYLQVNREKSIPTKSLHLNVRVSRIILNGNSQFPNVNTTAKTLTFYNDTILVLSTGENYILPETIIDLNANASSALKIYFDTTNRSFVVRAYGDNVIDGSWLFVCAVRKTSGALSISCPYSVNGKPFGLTIPDNAVKNPLDAHVKAILHRGYSNIAPENTIPAYTLSKKMGFSYVETDVRFTSDGVPVLIHDETVDRTSNGTGNITTMTLAEARALDFGSWKSAEYAGTKIPTFEEFILCCKKLNLHPYIQTVGNLTTEQATILVNTVKRLGMINRVSWISFVNPDLEKILALVPTARVGRISATFNDTILSYAKELKTSQNEVFLNIDAPSLTTEMIEKSNAEDILVETYTVNVANLVEGYVNKGIVGITTDSLNIAEILGN